MIDINIQTAIHLLHETYEISVGKIDQDFLKRKDADLKDTSAIELDQLIQGLRGLAEKQTTKTLDAADLFALLTNEADTSVDDRRAVRVALGYPAEDPEGVRMEFLQLAFNKKEKNLGVMSVVHFIPTNDLDKNPLVTTGGLHHPSSLYDDNVIYAQHGRHVYATDFPGVGPSHLNPWIYTGYHKMVEGFRLVADYALKKHPEKKIVIKGHSAGSTAIRHFMTHPEDSLNQHVAVAVELEPMPDKQEVRGGTKIDFKFLSLSALSILTHGGAHVAPVMTDTYAQNHTQPEIDHLKKIIGRERLPILPWNFLDVLFRTGKQVWLTDDDRTIVVFSEDDLAMRTKKGTKPRSDGAYPTRLFLAGADHDLMYGEMAQETTPQIEALIDMIEAQESEK